MATRGPRLSTATRAVWLLAAGALIAITAWAASSASAAPPASGDWVVTANESYYNQTIVIEGNVFVRAPGVLNLTNVTLEINSTTGARRGLLVESGAALRTHDLDDSTLTSLDRTVIRPVTNGERIWFVAAPGSTVNLQQTALWGVGYTQSPANASGVYLQTNATTLRNVTVFSSYFGIVFIGVVGSYTDITVQNNTYNGLDLDAGSNITVRGFLAADNGLAGVHIAGGRFTLVGASILHNSDGLAVKFGGRASATLFDASGNQNGFVALNGATLNLQQGRITNNTAAGVDARQTSTITLDGVTLSDNPTGLYGSLGSGYTMQGGNVVRGIRALQLRSASAANLTTVRIEGLTGDALDLDSSSANFMSCTFEGNAFGGQVTSAPSFGFLDSTLANSTGGGITLTDSPGAYFHSPTFVNNKGRAVDLAGSTTALVDGSGLIDRSVVDVDALSMAGNLQLLNATLHAVAARSWAIGGATLTAVNATIAGDVPGASLTLTGGWAYIRGLSIIGFDLRFSNLAVGPDVDGLALPAGGELAVTGGVVTWHNVTQSVGTGRVRAATGSLLVVGGSIAALRAEASGLIDLLDVTASLGSASYVGNGRIQQYWTATLATLWGPGIAAPNQPYTVTDAQAAPVAAGQTDGAGLAALGPVMVAVGTTGGVTALTPHNVTAGSSSWQTSAAVSIGAAGTYGVTLIDAVAPSLNITAPAAGARVSGTAVNITGHTADGESGLAALDWSFDNVTFTAAVAADPFTVQVPAQFETTYLVTLRSTDTAGNRAFAQISYRVDRTPPFISLLQPTNGSAVRGPTVRFAGGTEIGATLTINGTAASVDGSGNFDANVTLGEGLDTVGLTAVDLAGNVHFFEIELRVDSTPPGIVVFSPLNGSTVSTLTVDLIGFVEPGAGIWVDGVAQFALNNGSFNFTVDLNTEGENRLLLESVDAAGNANASEWVLFRDTHAPVISVAELPGAGPWAVNASSPDFSISTDEYAFIEASILPGGAATSASGVTLLFTPALSQGLFTLTVRATDAGGNAGTRTFQVRVDLTPPTFALDNRTEGGFVNNATWKVSLSAEAGANVTVAGVPALPTSPGSPNFEATIPLVNGLNTVLIVVTDAAGNRAVRSLTLTLDLVPPTLTIATPQVGASVTDAQVQVSGSTEPDAVVVVQGRTVPVDASGHFATIVNVGMGSTTITFTSTDPAGNTATLSRSVTRSSASNAVPGLDFIQANLWAILALVLVAAVAGGLASRGRGKRDGLDSKAKNLEREMEAQRAARNDLNALENFSPRAVDDKDFVSAEDFRRREAEGQPPSPPQP